jgi:hypothetical protein
MYQKPDFIKVSLKVSDVFANYLATGCPQEEYTNKTAPCENTPDYEHKTFTGEGWGHQCYRIFNP